MGKATPRRRQVLRGCLLLAVLSITGAAVTCTVLALGVGGVAAEWDRTSGCRPLVMPDQSLSRAACDVHGAEHTLMVFAVMLWVVWALGAALIALALLQKGRRPG